MKERNNLGIAEGVDVKAKVLVFERKNEGVELVGEKDVDISIYSADPHSFVPGRPPFCYDCGGFAHQCICEGGDPGPDETETVFDDDETMEKFLRGE